MSYEDSIYGNSQVNNSMQPILDTPGNVGVSPRSSADVGQDRYKDERPSSLDSSKTCARSFSAVQPHFFGLAHTQTQSERVELLARGDSFKENAPSSRSSVEEFPGLKFSSADELHNNSHLPAMADTRNTGPRLQNEWQYRSRAHTPLEDASESSFRRRPTPPNVLAPFRRSGSDDSNATSHPDNPSDTVQKERKQGPFHSGQTKSRPQKRRLSEDSFAGELPSDIKTKLVMRQYEPALTRPFSELDGIQDKQVSEKATLDPLSCERFESQESIDQPSAYKAGVSHTPSREPIMGESQESDQPSLPSAYRPTVPQPKPLPAAENDSQERSQDTFESELSQLLTSSQWAASFHGQQTDASTPQATQPATGEESMVTTNTNRRSILSMVDPAKRYRYTSHVREDSPIKPSLSPEIPILNTAEMDTESEAVATDIDTEPEMDATQPSAAANLEATGTVIGGNTQPPIVPPLLPLGRPLNITRLVSSDMDIVPDSEATQAVTQAVMPTSSPEIPLLLTPPKSRDEHKPQVPRNIHRDEVIPDSLIAQAEDDSEDDDDDIPLAVKVHKASVLEETDGKVEPAHEQQEPMVSPPTPPQTHSKTGAFSKGKERSTPSKRKPRREDTELIPSTYQHEEYVSISPKRGAQKASKGPAGKGGSKKSATAIKLAPPSTPLRARSLRSHTSATARRPDYRESTDEGDESDASVGPAFPRSVSDDVRSRIDRASTIDVEVDDPEKATTGHKRKHKSLPSAQGKIRTTSKPPEASSSPEPRSAKRRKSGSIARIPEGLPTRVFALWADDNYYYPGTVYARAAPGQYEIHFDDGTTDTVHISNLRRCELRKGDDILFGKERGIVSSDTPEVMVDKISIQVDDEPEIVDLVEVKVTSRTVATWQDRWLSEDDIVPMNCARQLFHKMAFVLTFRPKFEKANEAKRNLTSTIKRNGGEVLEDWADIFTLEGKLMQRGARWELSKSDVIRKAKHEKIQKVFLLSDDTSNKPRFLIALALGIPCLDVEWVHDATKLGSSVTEKWHRYLLPAGLSQQVNGRPSQLIDMDWCNSNAHLDRIMDNRIAAKPFQDENILCLSPDFVPKGQGNSNDHPQTMIPRIVLCMGAHKVEAVGDIKHASHKASEYDMIVLKDEDVKKRSALQGAVCVTVSWVKDCLISSRKLPLPFENEH